MDNLLITQETSTILLISISLLGGIIASISPCSLSILPLIIAYVGGYSKSSPIKTFFEMLFFIFGSSIVFGIIGIICAITGKVFSSFAPAYFNLIIASIILTMGLNMLNIIELNIPTMIKEIPQLKKGNIFIYPFLLGCIFSLAGTPCSTPILASIMAFASSSKNIYISMFMLISFAIGQGLILVIAGVFTSTLKHIKRFSIHSDIIIKICGILFVISAFYLFYKIFLPLF